MTVIGLIVILGITIVVPFCIGAVPMVALKGQVRHPAMMWISGCMIMWALFQVLCVALIVQNLETNYVRLRKLYLPILLGMAAVGGVVGLIRFGKVRRSAGKSMGKAPVENDLVRVTPEQEKGSARTVGKYRKIAWVIFTALVLFQLVMAVVYTYGDGDDAYYVAVSTITKESETMYRLSPYAMGSTDMDIRHSLAPFPVWIALLSDYSGLRVATVAHTVLPPILILLSYAVFYSIARILYGSKSGKTPVFLSFMALLILFGDTAAYTAENFMIARSRQGKAALGSIVIPVLFLLMLYVMERMKEKQKVGIMPYLLMACTVTFGCLCTTLGSFLTSLLLACFAFCIAVTYRSFGILVKTFLSCLPACAFAALYLFWGR